MSYAVEIQIQYNMDVSMASIDEEIRARSELQRGGCEREEP